jgi:hypothetical protein
VQLLASIFKLPQQKPPDILNNFYTDHLIIYKQIVTLILLNLPEMQICKIERKVVIFLAVYKPLSQKMRNFPEIMHFDQSESLD